MEVSSHKSLITNSLQIRSRIMQDLIEGAIAVLPTENVRNPSNKGGRTFRLRRKVAKHRDPWELPASNENLVHSPQRLVLCCLVAAAIALLFLGREQLTVSDWGSKSVRSVSVARSPSDPEFTTEHDEESEEERPPLHTLIGDLDNNITGDVEFLLDFAIVGHPKTATTFTMHWLASQDEIQMYGHEMHSLTIGKPAELASQLYKLPAGTKYKRGYKAPKDISSIQALDSIAEYWPDCKLVVGLRHPVSWFESFYNFRVRHGVNMPPADSYIGKCPSDSHGVCTLEAQFHLHLNLLGKTNQTTAGEKRLLKPLPSKVPALAPMHNQVFLYEISQLGDKDEDRAYKYRRDLGNFLGLQHEISPIVHTDERIYEHSDLDICEDRYRPLRRALMDIGKPASEWIRTYFMQSPEVAVSSPEFFNDLLLEWMEDPCDKESDEDDPERRRLPF